MQIGKFLRKYQIKVALVLGSVIVLWWSGLAAEVKERYSDLQIFTKVLNLVQQYYVEEVDTKKLVYGAIRGMLQELDPHTNFLSPDMFKEFENETSGEFGGLGIEITIQNDILTVISPIEDTPAWEAGIQAGDKIVEINGDSTKGFSLAEAAQKMRGKRGSKVKLGIYREGFDKPRDFVVNRGVVKIKSVKLFDLDDGYGYVRLTSFIENSASDFDRALKQLAETQKEVKGIIIDLRRNPGGLLDQAVKISDMFLESGVIVSTMGRGRREKEVISAKREGTYPNFPIVVLVNEFSASAAEILAGALQDNRRALIMGQPTFGKGSVQSVVKLGDGSGLKLTVARYYTPSGRSIQAEGIKPDVLVEEIDSEAFRKAVVKREVRREQDITNHLMSEKEKKNSTSKKEDRLDDNMAFWYKQMDAKKTNLKPKDKLLGEDFQVLQAYNYLKAWKVMETFGSKKSIPVTLPTEEGAAAPTSPATDPNLKSDSLKDDKKLENTKALKPAKKPSKPQVKPAPTPTK